MKTAENRLSALEKRVDGHDKDIKNLKAALALVNGQYVKVAEQLHGKTRVLIHKAKPKMVSALPKT